LTIKTVKNRGIRVGIADFLVGTENKSD